MAIPWKPGMNVILTGFMGTGKSSVGSLLARRLGLSFLDTDALIERETGMSIRDIFRTRGEAHFRRTEARVVRRACALGNTVISLGGGALMDLRNADLARRSGVVVWLRASPEAILGRLLADPDNEVGGRPALNGQADMESVRALQRAREPGYSRAHITVDTDGRAVADVTLEIASAIGAAATSRPAPSRSQEGQGELTDIEVRVAAGGSTYPCFVGHGTLARLGSCLSAAVAEGLQDPARCGRRVIVVTSPLLRCLFGDAVNDGLREWSRDGIEPVWAIVPDGERAKTLSALRGLYDLACAARARRDWLVVALGGGTVGDVAGFFAATYMRGLGLVQVPTTLLAMVDSAIGGKAAVNLKAGKNLAGTFWQPAAVVSDVGTLASLPPGDLASGLAETIKTAVIGDSTLFEILEDAADAVGREESDRNKRPARDAAARRMPGRDRFRVAGALRQNPALLQTIVLRAASVKAAVVSRDVRDQGERMLLNLGHTLGHAIEQAGGFRAWTHGEAVAIGLAAACRASTRLGRLPRESCRRVVSLLARMGLPTSVPADAAARLRAKIEAAMGLDKKAGTGGLRIVLPYSIGECAVERGVPGEALIAEMAVESEREGCS